MLPRRLDRMDTFLIQLLIPIYLVISLSLVTSYARAVEPPRERILRSGRDLESGEIKSPFKVKAHPYDVYLYPDQPAQVFCRAKGGSKIKQTPFVTFHREFSENTHVQLSSGDEDVLITAVPTEDLKGENRVKNILTLGRKAWDTLTNGPNIFYCKATDMDGQYRAVDYFTVYKELPNFMPMYPNKRLRHKRQRLSVIIE